MRAYPSKKVLNQASNTHKNTATVVTVSKCSWLLVLVNGNGMGRWTSQQEPPVGGATDPFLVAVDQ